MSARTADALPNVPVVEDREETLLTWQIHPLRDRPHFASLVALGYALAFTLWRVIFPHPVALFLPTVALTVALSEYLFPTVYRITNRGVHADCLISRLFIAWPDVKRATAGADGVFLSPFSRASRLDNFRGVRLRFAGGNNDAVCDMVKQQRAAQEQNS